jgi:hypothetical protein
MDIAALRRRGRAGARQSRWHITRLWRVSAAPRAAGRQLFSLRGDIPQQIVSLLETLAGKRRFAGKS